MTDTAAVTGQEAPMAKIPTNGQCEAQAEWLAAANTDARHRAPRSRHVATDGGNAESHTRLLKC
jgi:hypothetical protein